jgi:predicted dehydrogenase
MAETIRLVTSAATKARVFKQALRRWKNQRGEAARSESQGSPTLCMRRAKAAVNAPHSKRFARFKDARQSRSVWTARVFSTAFRAGKWLVASRQKPFDLSLEFRTAPTHLFARETFSPVGYPFVLIMKTQPRRKFILQTAAFAAAAPFIGALSSCARAAESDRKLGFALCGLGSLSTNQIAPALQKTKNCRLAGIVTGTPAKAERWKSQYNIPEKNIYNYGTMEKMADNPDIDVVYVVTPNALHAEHTIKAAKAGKHVLCEKPMEATPEKCQQIIDACKAANRMLAVGYRCRFEPHNIECVRLAREKVFGDLKIIEAEFGIDIGDPNQWRLKKALAGGGALMDVGIYALQATRYISGEEPILVSAIETKTDVEKFKEVDESVVWQLKFPSGVIAHCSTSYNTAVVGRYTGIADRGWFELNPAFYYGGNRGRRSDGEEIRLPQVDQFAAEMDDFAQCIRENKPTKVPGEEGLRDVKIMMAIYESAKTGNAVKLG